MDDVSTAACRMRSGNRTDDEILFVGRHDHRLLVDVFASVTEDLLADLSDVLESRGRTGRIKDQYVGGCLSQPAEGLRSGFGRGAVQVPLLERIFRKFVDGREIGNVNFDDAIIGHQTGGVAMRMRRRPDAVAELVADELLQNWERRC